MFEPFILFFIVFCYLLFLFAAAYYAEKREQEGRSIVNNPYIYSLSLAVYCTSWTFYGSVGKAATSGLSFLPVYLGPTLMATLWLVILRKVVRIARANRITTISDFFGSRYGQSLALSALIAIVAVIGITPYMGLQIKAIITTLTIITGKTTVSIAAGLFITLILGVFAVIFGARSLQQSERHSGLVFAIAFESIVKLAAFLLVGIFVTYHLFDGFLDIFSRVQGTINASLLSVGPGSETDYGEWFALLLISMMAIMFLPRQFQMAVVENYDEAHISKAAWLFPLYLLLINIFVLPIALGGLLLGGTPAEADSFVLTIPLSHGQQLLSLFVFIGGFSAAIGMVIVEALALSTMVMNSIIMPTLVRYHEAARFPAIILNIKRMVILAIVFLGYLFAVLVGEFYSLVDMGLKSFEAVTLFAPAFILGLYWKKGNRTGAIAGITAGFIIWFYTLLVPALMKAGLIESAGLMGGIVGSEMLNPNSLFGITGLGKWSHSLLWSLLFNLLCYIGLSIMTKQTKDEEIQSLIFVESYEKVRQIGVGTYDIRDVEAILGQYLGKMEAHEAVRNFVDRKGKSREELTSRDIHELRNEAERILSGAIGSSMAAIICGNRFVLTEKEREEISQSIKQIADDLRFSRQELAEANRELQYRATMEKHIATISTNFINLSLLEIDGGIRKALQTIGEFAGIDRGYVFLFSADGMTLSRSHEWSRNGARADRGIPAAMDVGSFPWLVTKLRGFESIHIHRIAELPADAAYERDFFASRDIQCLIIVPMVYGNTLRGFLGVEQVRITKTWLEEDITMLKFLGEIFVNALERKRAEEELKVSEELFRSLVESIPLPVLITHLESGRILFGNGLVTPFFGGSAGTHLAMSIDDLYADRRDRERFMWELLSRGYVNNYELRLKRVDGTGFDVLASAKIITYRGERAALSILTDITERKIVEQQLRKLFRAVEQSPTAVMITDAKAVIEYVNPRFVQMTGYAVEEVLGQNPRILKSGETPPEEYGKLWETIMKGGEWRGIFHNRKKNGDLYWASVSISPIRSSEGVITHFLEVQEDITEQKRLEEQLRHSQKLEAVGQLAGGIAHDFNNILTAIIGYGSLLQMIMSDDDPSRPHVDQILTLADKAANLTQSLLAFSRKQIIFLKPIDVNEIIRRVEKLLSRLIGEDIELRTLVAEDDLMIMGDSGQIEQVLMNLVTNSRDAMPDGGVLSIETARAEINTEFIQHYGFGEPGAYAVISVTDTGVGMDEKTKERIFEPFFTTKEVGKGTGLGLSIVYGIVRQHNGYINVDSEPGKGTTFRIYFPLIKSDVQKAGLKEETALQGGTETILVAEDEPEVRKITKAMLERFGYDVIEAVDGEDAVRKFKENKDTVRLLLFDVIMPKKNGKEAYEEIAAMQPGIRVLFTSGYAPDIIHKKGILEEGINFITKPVTPKDLLKKVRQVLEA